MQNNMLSQLKDLSIKIQKIQSNTSVILSAPQNKSEEQQGNQRNTQQNPSSCTNHLQQILSKLRDI